MKALMAVAVAVLLVAIPASASHRQADYESLVRWAGCEASLVTDDEREIVESYYNITSRVLRIGTKDRADLPRQLSEIILFHEIGHCLQQQAGLFDAYTPSIALELDADRWAADLACGLGRDGQQQLHDLFVWAKKTFEYEGDSAHGTLAQRIAQGRNAVLCRIIPTQAPLVTQ